MQLKILLLFSILFINVHPQSTCVEIYVFYLIVLWIANRRLLYLQLWLLICLFLSFICRFCFMNFEVQWLRAHTFLVVLFSWCDDTDHYEMSPLISGNSNFLKVYLLIVKKSHAVNYILLFIFVSSSFFMFTVCMVYIFLILLSPVCVFVFTVHLC